MSTDRNGYLEIIALYPKGDSDLQEVSNGMYTTMVMSINNTESYVHTTRITNKLHSPLEYLLDPFHRIIPR